MQIRIRWANGDEYTYTGVKVLKTLTPGGVPSANVGELWLVPGQITALRVYDDATPNTSTGPGGSTFDS